MLTRKTAEPLAELPIIRVWTLEKAMMQRQAAQNEYVGLESWKCCSIFFVDPEGLKSRPFHHCLFSSDLAQALHQTKTHSSLLRPIV